MKQDKVFPVEKYGTKSKSKYNQRTCDVEIFTKYGKRCKPSTKSKKKSSRAKFVNTNHKDSIWTCSRDKSLVFFFNMKCFKKDEIKFSSIDGKLHVTGKKHTADVNIPEMAKTFDIPNTHVLSESRVQWDDDGACWIRVPHKL